jgi:hypothetical protein
MGSDAIMMRKAPAAPIQNKRGSLELQLAGEPFEFQRDRRTGDLLGFAQLTPTDRSFTVVSFISFY